jgi:hypothetical protein
MALKSCCLNKEAYVGDSYRPSKSLGANEASLDCESNLAAAKRSVRALSRSGSWTSLTHWITATERLRNSMGPLCSVKC